MCTIRPRLPQFRGSEPIAPVHHCTGMGWQSLRTINTDSATAQTDGTPLARMRGVFERERSSRVFYLHNPQALDNAAKSVSGIHDLWRKGR